MELKLFSVKIIGAPSVLLIVPYGIETWKHVVLPALSGLLIVPYGIETPAALQVNKS